MPDEIIREIKTIQRYARHNEAEDLRFRTYLKVGLNLSNAQLDAVVREETEAVWARIDCLTCGHCCRTLQVVVDDADIRRLAARQKMSFRDFSRRYVALAEDRIKHLAASPCPFLGADNRCAVYEDRPKACRNFPYLHEDGFRHRTLSMIADQEVCPIVFNVWQRLKRRLWKRRK